MNLATVYFNRKSGRFNLEIIRVWCCISRPVGYSHKILSYGTYIFISCVIQPWEAKPVIITLPRVSRYFEAECISMLAHPRKSGRCRVYVADTNPFNSDCYGHLTYVLAGKGCAKCITSDMINVGLRLRKGVSDITYAEDPARGK